MEKRTSFAFEVKSEIASKNWEDSCKRSMLSAFARINGSLRISGGRDELDLATESAPIAKMLYTHVHSLYGVGERFSYSKGIGFSRRTKYHCLVAEPDMVLGDLEVDYFSSKIPANVVASSEQEAAYLAGAFLAAGSVSAPASSNYHLEIAVTDPSYAKWLSHLLNKTQNHQFTSKVIKRRNQWVVYLKRGDQVSDFLILVGASESCLKFENARIDRDFANVTNRLHNLDAANMGKTVSAAERQVKEIVYFKNHPTELASFNNPKLEALMDLRLAHPDASLNELAELLSEELASEVSRSNINHLFRKIHEEYEGAIK